MFFLFVCFLLTADRVLLWTLKFVNAITQDRSDVGVSNATGASTKSRMTLTTDGLSDPEMV